MFDDPMAFILTVDKSIFFWVLAITFFFSIAVVAVISRDRKWYELVCLFMLIHLGCVLLSGVIFTYVLHVPFAHLELVAVP